MRWSQISVVVMSRRHSHPESTSFSNDWPPVPWHGTQGSRFFFEAVADHVNARRGDANMVMPRSGLSSPGGRFPDHPGRAFPRSKTTDTLLMPDTSGRIHHEIAFGPT